VLFTVGQLHLQQDSVVVVDADDDDHAEVDEDEDEEDDEDEDEDEDEEDDDDEMKVDVSGCWLVHSNSVVVGSKAVVSSPNDVVSPVIEVVVVVGLCGHPTTKIPLEFV
jgi:hypothetical protein